MTEADFIAALRALPLHGGAEGLMDDAAVLEVGGEALILTHDMIAEGVHYRAGTDPADIAWKLVAVNLSDLAAKGAEPIGVLIGATLDGSSARFVEGLGEVLDTYSVRLLGGDTISTGAPATFGCTAIGRATTRPVPRRSGARPGDALYVTGTIGAAMLGFQGTLEGAFLRPKPRLAEGRALAPLVHAMMDVSDGLLLDAQRMAAASGCTAALTLAAIPYAPGILAEGYLAAASWGDDYELLFAAPADIALPVEAKRIGTMLPAGPEPLLIDGNSPPARLGYEHS